MRVRCSESKAMWKEAIVRSGEVGSLREWKAGRRIEVEKKEIGVCVHVVHSSHSEIRISYGDIYCNSAIASEPCLAWIRCNTELFIMPRLTHA